MPLGAIVRTETQEQLRSLPDPSGGTFDAAGDFDRLIPTTGSSLLDDVDPHGDTVFNSLQAVRFRTEIAALEQTEGLSDIERRGLARLRVMVERVAGGTHLYLWFIGDWRNPSARTGCASRATHGWT